MKRTYWVIGACLSLLLVGGLATDVSAQQSAPPAAPTETKPDSGTTQPSPPSQAPPPSGGQMQQQPPSSNTQIESRTERSTTVVEREGSKIFGVEPTVAMIIGAVLLVVIVIALVAMSRRTGEVDAHTHHRV